MKTVDAIETLGGVNTLASDISNLLINMRKPRKNGSRFIYPKMVDKWADNNTFSYWWLPYFIALLEEKGVTLTVQDIVELFNVEAVLDDARSAIVRRQKRSAQSRPTAADKRATEAAV